MYVCISLVGPAAIYERIVGDLNRFKNLPIEIKRNFANFGEGVKCGGGKAIRREWCNYIGFQAQGLGN